MYPPHAFASTQGDLPEAWLFAAPDPHNGTLRFWQISANSTPQPLYTFELATPFTNIGSIAFSVDG
jgi:hypothetical protein